MGLEERLLHQIRRVKPILELVRKVNPGQE